MRAISPGRGSTLLAAGAVVAVLAGCGSASVSNADRLDGLTAVQAVQQAYDQLSKKSYKAEFTQKTSYDTSGLSAQAATFGTALQAAAQQTTSTEVVQSPSRLKLTVKLPTGKSMYMVSYDGTVYVSADDSTYKEAPFLSALAQQIAVAQTSDFATHLTSIQDVAKATEGGATVEHFKASVAPDFVTQLTQSVMGGLGVSSSISSALTASMTTTASSVDMFINRHTGLFAHQALDLQLSLDVSKMLTALGQTVPPDLGTVKVIGDTTYQFHDFGSPASLTKPTSAGQLSPTDFAALFQ